MKRIFVGIVCAVGGIVAVIMLAGIIMAWRLSAGPVALGFLTPLMELALNTMSGPARVAVEDAVFTWHRSDRTLNVRLVEARAASSSEEVVLSVPEMSVALSMDALLRAEIAPTEIDIVRPDLKVVRHGDDRSVSKSGEDGNIVGPALSKLMSALAELSDPETESQGLREIRVENGSLDVKDHDTGLSWQGTLDNTRIWRDPAGINAKVFLQVSSEGQRSDLAVTAEYLKSKQQLGAGVSFARIRPAMFAALGSSVRALAAVDLPVRGTTGLLVDQDGTVVKLEFDLHGGAGHLALPVSVAQEFGILGAAQRLAVRGVELNGIYDGRSVALDVDHLSIDLEPGETVYLPAPIDHKMPLAALRGQGKYRGEDKTAKVESLVIDLRGPSIAMSGTAEGFGTAGGLRARAEIVAKDIQTNDFPTYWPSSLAPNAYEWCTEHLSDGGISEARIELSATQSADGIEIASLSGTMDIQGVTIDYLPPMPKARNASGVGSFDLSGLTVNILGAEAFGVSVRGGTAKLYDFGKAQEMADIDLSIAGPIPRILELIDHPPLGYAKAMDLDPAQTRGSASGRLRLQFPLVVDLPLDRLRVSAQAKLENIFVAKIALGASVTAGTLSLDLDEKGMDVNGSVVVESTPANIVWRENFESGAPFDTRLVVDIADARFSVLEQVQLRAVTVIEEMIDGPLGVNIEYVAYPGGKDTVSIKTDATRAAIVLPYLDWQKPAGVAGTVEFKAILHEQRLKEIPHFAMKSQGLDIRGGAQYTAAGQLESVHLRPFVVGRTDMEASVAVPPGGGWAVDADGKSLNIGPLIDTLRKSDTDDQARGLENAPLSVTAKIDTVWIDEKHPLKSLTASIVRDDERWSLVKIDARVGKDTPLSLSITPGKNQSRSLQVRSDNAGDTLRGLGIYDRMLGGKLKINGSFDDTVAGSPLNGTVKIRDYRITNAPGLAKVLSIMALTGILDQLRGKGLGFAIFNAPFTLHNDVLEIANARASGTELGLTAEGRVANNIINIKGTIVPFYAVNSALGKIPLVGSIFSGGEKGGGLLAARYSITGPMDDPDVTVNPLSMLTPGFLRNLFNVFESDSGSGSGSGSNGNAEAPLPQPGPHHP